MLSFCPYTFLIPQICFKLFRRLLFYHNRPQYSYNFLQQYPCAPVQRRSGRILSCRYEYQKYHKQRKYHSAHRHLFQFAIRFLQTSPHDFALALSLTLRLHRAGWTFTLRLPGMPVAHVGDGLRPSPTFTFYSNTHAPNAAPRLTASVFFCQCLKKFFYIREYEIRFVVKVCSAFVYDYQLCFVLQGVHGHVGGGLDKQGRAYNQHQV